MVVKLKCRVQRVNPMFESGVVSYGSQAFSIRQIQLFQFESGVVSYGSQARVDEGLHYQRFESGVVSYGSQARAVPEPWAACLRAV